MPRLSSLLALLISSLPALAQGFSPEDAVKRMKLPPGFSARVVASEPTIRQPVSLSFDERGRLWVLQYLQYPNYAGLKPVKQDQYLRTIWDKLPDPPPRGPKGADRLTILSDPDENGVFTKSKDFATGMNIASGFCLGDGGVYVAQPPYLLYYPDVDRDDVPDREPMVLLTGFGMDDTHSLANSLQWGPDGWLYGAAGSTSTCRITNPADPKAPPVEFQQGIWRYHPKTKTFELFSEGGGNTYGLDFDKNGQAIAGTNWGGFAMLHQMQGAYYVKGFSKHGPLHNPHTYGYFDHVPYTGFKGGHVTCGGVVYQADAYPAEFRDQYIGANLLSNAIYWHKLEPHKSSFKARHGGDLLEANDTWFRPVDLLTGPDGCVYVADFYDKRAAHLDPIDNWDRTNGRIYRIEYNGPPKPQTFDLSKKTAAELVELLKHPNKWWRDEARRQMRERGGDAATLRAMVTDEKNPHALEALWALYQIGEWAKTPIGLQHHPNEYVRAWAVRLTTDRSPETDSTLPFGVLNEFSPVVLAQVACSARRIKSRHAPAVVNQLLQNTVCDDDPQLPLLIWWAIEEHLTRSRGSVFNWLNAHNPPPRLYHATTERFARRMTAVDMDHNLRGVAYTLQRAAPADKSAVLRGIAKGLEGRTLPAVPGALVEPLEAYWSKNPDDPLVTEVMARMNVPSARIELRRKVSEGTDAERVRAIDLLRQLRDAKAKVLFLAQLKASPSEPVKVALLAGLEGFDDPAIGEAVLAGYAGFPPAVKKRAVQLLVARPLWASALFAQLDAGKFPKAEITLDNAKAAAALADAKVTAVVEKHFGKFAAATPGEKQARISWLGAALSRNGPTDLAKGKALFTKHCATCHTLHGEGGKVGPDLTTADRKNRGYMLTHSVDPSAYIRPEFMVHTVATADGRKLSGIVAESGAESVILVNVVNDQPTKTVVAKKDIDDLKPSAVSLMPEKLLDTLKDAEVADLFAYLASDPKPAAKGGAKKLKLALVSGSFEYKSDESLAAFQKHLEATYPVECVRIFAKAEKDKAFAGIEKLKECDAAVFYTRRLQIEGESLDAVKAFVASKKPIVGVRTASHGFQNWLAMDKDVFGGNYGNHYGAKIVCDVTIAPSGKDHPILKGVSGFKSNGSLYKNPNVAADVTVLLSGAIPGNSEPVAWVREKDGRRVFYTSLGHPDDFKDENFTRLLVNGLMWATKSDWSK